VSETSGEAEAFLEYEVSSLAVTKKQKTKQYQPGSEAVTSIYAAEEHQSTGRRLRLKMTWMY